MFRYFSFIAGQIEIGVISQIQISGAICDSIITDCQFIGFCELIFYFYVYIARISSFHIRRVENEADTGINLLPLPYLLVKTGCSAMIGVFSIVFLQLISSVFDGKRCLMNAVSEPAYSGSHIIGVFYISFSVIVSQQNVFKNAMFIGHMG